MRSAVGRYEALREIGRGGWATVYLARQIELARLVALKELRALPSDPSVARRFLREAQLAGSLGHPNIVTVHEYFEHRGTPYIAMEYLERGSLRQYLGRMTLAQVAGVLEGVLAGLAYAEEHRVVHRDLKPENLLVTGEGRIKISDFGIAKATHTLQTGAIALTSTGVAVGTPNYMAPEQALSRNIGPWTDLYSVGIMAFEFFVGLPPFVDTEEPMGVLLRQVNETIPPANELNPEIDPRLSDWIGHLVSKDANERPQSARAAWEEVEETFIALLGARWRRAAPLGPPPEVPRAQHGPANGPAPLPVFVGDPTNSEAATEPLGGFWGARTVPPGRPAELATTASLPPKSRRGRRAATVLFVAVALVAAAAAALSRGGQAPQSSGPAASLGGQTTAGNVLPSPSQTPPPWGSSGGSDMAAEAKNARALSKQYDDAATKAARVRGAGESGSPQARLVPALQQAAAAYREAATAADARNAAGYAAAIASANAARTAADAAVADLGATGSQPSEQSEAPEQQEAEEQPSAPCGGDSASDDPSDESCSP